ncbi:MAG: alpha/beta fold hydrolase [Woeseia sp.]
MLRRFSQIAGLIVLALIVVALWTWPTAPELVIEPPVIDAAADGWLAANETLIDNEFGIYAATEKRVRWQVGKAGTQTEFAVVYLHGFSATRQEIAPVSRKIADALGANLFETRLTGHGLKSHKLENVTAEDWLMDTAEALAIGKKIGKRIILIGTSTGATLALAAAEVQPQDVAALILISPNFSPRDEGADAMLWPGGPILTRLFLGKTHRWEPANPMQARFWTSEYPTAAIIEVMRLVKAIRLSLPLQLQQPLLVFLSPDDDVINVDRAIDSLAQISAPAKEIVEVKTEAPANHVLAGDILAPSQTDPVVQKTLEFLNTRLPGNVTNSGL